VAGKNRINNVLVYFPLLGIIRVIKFKEDDMVGACGRNGGEDNACRGLEVKPEGRILL
jgi:hypothetical protein